MDDVYITDCINEVKRLFGSIVTNDMSERQRSIIENYIKLLDKQNIQVILANVSKNRRTSTLQTG